MPEKRAEAQLTRLVQHVAVVTRTHLNNVPQTELPEQSAFALQAKLGIPSIPASHSRVRRLLSKPVIGKIRRTFSAMGGLPDER
jgi:hypothetical protein